MSKIEWTGKTWNPTIGCTEISPGCTNCYAAKMAYRLMHIPAMKDDYAGIAKRLDNGRIVFTGLVKELPDRLREPLERKKPTTYFVDSMSDLFHQDVSWNYLYKVFEVMLLTPHHTYQVLTKRADHYLIKHVKDVYFHLQRNYPARMFEFEPDGSVKPLKNVHIGVSVENQKQLDSRYPFLDATPAAVRFLSVEPLISAIDMRELFGLYEYDENKFALKVGDRWKNSPDWIIAGGESGTGKLIRPVHPDWIRTMRNQCIAADVPFFFKQWGRYIHPSQYQFEIGAPTLECCKRIEAHGTEFYDVGKEHAGNVLDGAEWTYMPGDKYDNYVKNMYQ